MRKLTLWEWLFFLALGGWLLAAAAVVDIEYYDGLDSIVNARFYTGQTAEYAATRGPLMGLLLIPAEALRAGFGLHPLEFRPYHFTMALLHFAMIFLTWKLLRSRFENRAAILVACAAALPTFIFFSYAPFISHDILPGILLLGMLIAAEDWRQRGRPSSWLLLTLLGSCAAMIKFTFGLFWIAVLLAQGIFAFTDRTTDSRTRFNRFLLLGFSALAGAALTWLVMCAALKSVFPDVPFLDRAIRQIQYLATQAHDKSRPEPIWIYLRNLPAFGILAMLLILPGLWLSLRGNRLQKSGAIAWILLVIAFHALNLRQVRYLAFLGPVTALLILPVLTKLHKNKLAWSAAIFFLMLNWVPKLPYNCFGESTRIFREEFYRKNPARELLAPLYISKEVMMTAFPLYRDSDLRRPVLVNWRMLSFLPARNSPLTGDIYHDLFHFGNHHLQALYGYNPGEVIGPNASVHLQSSKWPENSAMVFSSPPGAIALNPTDGSHGAADFRHDLVTLTLVRAAYAFQILPDGSATNRMGQIIHTAPATFNNEDALTFSGEGIDEMLQNNFDGLQLEIAGISTPLPAFIATDRRVFVPKMKLGDAAGGYPATQFRMLVPMTQYRPDYPTP